MSWYYLEDPVKLGSVHYASLRELTYHIEMISRLQRERVHMTAELEEKARQEAERRGWDSYAIVLSGWEGVPLRPLKKWLEQEAKKIDGMAYAIEIFAGSLAGKVLQEEQLDIAGYIESGPSGAVLRWRRGAFVYEAPVYTHTK